MEGLRLRGELVRLGWQTSPGLAGAVAAVLAARAVLPLAQILAVGRAVEAVQPAIAAGEGSPQAGRLVAALLVVGVLFAAGQAVAPLVDLVGDRLGFGVRGCAFERTLRAVLRPATIRHLEDPAFADVVQSATAFGLYGPRTAVRMFVNQWGQRLAALGGFVAVAHHSLLAALVLVLAVAFDIHRTRRRFLQILTARQQGVSVLRRADYLRELMLSAGAEKEVRVFGFGSWLIGRFRSEWMEGMDEQRRSRRGMWVDECLGLAPLLAVIGIIGWSVCVGAIDGSTSLATAVIVLQGLFVAPAAAAVTTADAQLELALGAIGAVIDLEEAVARPELALSGSASPAGLPAREIRFEGVAFTYAGRETPVFEGLDLTIPAGTSLAVVGANGVGKTTLVKLLCRLYDPTVGRITVDGQPLTDVDPASWQERNAVIFQDFVHYPWSAADNVAPAGSPDPAHLRAAAEQAGAADLIERLEQGWDTVLSRQHGGTDLSGGQWQRIALARALHAAQRGAPVLILDEPTAQLDVRQEAAFYDRFLEVTEGRTVVVISHRFSTVRRADRIVVLEDGAVVESGSHDELVAAKGRYAEMFELQASRFADGGL